MQGTDIERVVVKVVSKETIACSVEISTLLQVRGYGLSADAHHITQPAPDGRGALLAMQRALCKSSVAASDVPYINAHAPSTPLGDAVEAAAIAKLFNFPQADTAEKMMAHAMEPTVGEYLDIDSEKKVHWPDFKSPFLPPRVKAC